MHAPSSHRPDPATGGVPVAADASGATSSGRSGAAAGRPSRSQFRLDPFQQEDGLATRCRRALGAWLARARATPRV